MNWKINLKLYGTQNRQIKERLRNIENRVRMSKVHQISLWWGGGKRENKQRENVENKGEAIFEEKNV